MKPPSTAFNKMACAVDAQPLCKEDEVPSHDHRVKSIASQNTSLHSQWLEFRKDLGSRVHIVNTWTAQYKGLLTLLTRSTGIDAVERGILKLQELEETVARLFEYEVGILASEDNLVKLAATK